MYDRERHYTTGLEETGSQDYRRIAQTVDSSPLLYHRQVSYAPTPSLRRPRDAVTRTLR